jgi:enterochelin esterase-like enzyme
MASVKGCIKDRTIHSRALCKPMRLRLYLPPYYGEFDVRYPVVYLLHPWGEDEHYWTDELRFHQVADHLINAGTIPPFIAVMPQGDKSFFVNAEDPGGDFSMIVRLAPDFYAGALDGYGDYADYILQDVIPAVERTEQTRTDRAGRVIGGVSMGGAGAAVLAFTHPRHFGAVGIHSPFLFTAERLGPPWIFGLGDEEAFARLDPVHLAKRLSPGDALRIHVDCGADDEMGMSAPTADLHYALVERDVPHAYVSLPGRHNADYWRANLAQYLGFYAAGW